MQCSRRAVRAVRPRCGWKRSRETIPADYRRRVGTPLVSVSPRRAARETRRPTGGEKPPRGVGSEPGDRQDWQRISGKMRRKSMPLLSVPGALVGGDEVTMAVFHELSRAEGPSQQTTRTDCKTSESPAWMVLRTPRVGGHAQSRPRNLRPTHARSEERRV